jgi:stage V sporulation protein D (sporulation-specific penicillin-binding protein)
MMISVLLFGCLGRVAYIMTAKGEEYRVLAANNQLRDTVISGVRGTVYDCNMTPVVTSCSSWNLCVNSYKFNLAFKKNEDEKSRIFENVAKSISEATGCEKETVLEAFSKSNNPNVRLAKNISGETRLCLEENFKKLVTTSNGKDVDLRDFFFYENDNIRLYPENNFASTLIGVVNADGDGETGIESYYNDVLKGEKGRILSARDSRGNEISSGYETIIDPKEGNGIVLTVDKNIQTYLENALSKALSSSKAKRWCISWDSAPTASGPPKK